MGINVAAYAMNGHDHSLKEYFDKLGVDFQIHRLNFEGRTLRYVSTGIEQDSAPILLFIHGAPGNLDNFKAYLADYDLKTRFRLISMDRLGYGGSDYGKSETDILTQARSAEKILNQYQGSKAIVAGYSYGGPIAGKLASIRPDLINGLVLIAPLNDPYNEPMKWYSKLSNTKFIRYFMPGLINVASDEKMTHAQELRKIEDDWKSIECPVLYIHGNEDGLAPFEENLTFSKNEIDSVLLKIDPKRDMGHMLIWENARYIKDRILEFAAVN